MHQGRQHKLHILFLLLMQVARDKMDLHSKNGMFFNYILPNLVEETSAALTSFVLESFFPKHILFMMSLDCICNAMYVYMQLFSIPDKMLYSDVIIIYILKYSLWTLNQNIHLLETVLLHNMHNNAFTQSYL